MDLKEKKQLTKQKHPHIQPSPPAISVSGTHFKPSSEVKGLRFGAQIIVRSFTVRRVPPSELLRLLSLPPTHNVHLTPHPFPSTTTYLPTSFTILAHQAWHTLTLGLGTKKSKAIVFVFDSKATRSAIDPVWPPNIALGDVNRKLLRGLIGYEMARFKFRKGALTFYVYAVRRTGAVGFSSGEDLRVILESMVKLTDFLDHTAMLAVPTHKSISFSPPVGMAH